MHFLKKIKKIILVSANTTGERKPLTTTDDHFKNPDNLCDNCFSQEALEYVIWNAIGSGFGKTGVQFSKAVYRVGIGAPYTAS